ncbi:MULTISPECIES: cyclopropane-fatty-acyl-phospholipid synthase family protein [Bradyrhizobium]|uniref:cyclopropane-fatty-acyl-phospholipid synthase family protein n=1 Tax=Bradyrhizobium TaxID=374 RepID=UPI00293E0221|nr:cyclopropane-fatty-acyl-phospholipid synthase family protein [Bradyrhizobium sp. NDS-1]WOH73105.1 cyclopropane-fatty-acyl-phospholipid synthase family protein [Bradyrhizobium sp. NDS-1]
MDLAATHPAVQFDGVPFFARLALRLASQLRCGTLHVRLPDQRMVTLRGQLQGPSATIELKNYRFARSLVIGGDIGMAEAYIRGDWTTPDLAQLLYVFCLNEELVDSAFAGNMLVRLCRRALHRLRRNTKEGSRHNIHRHYDLGNEFFAAWLDSSMTYSSGLFSAETADLPAAQQHKYEQLAKAIELEPGQSVLEIGCGWGGFAEFTAKTYGAKVLALTISKEQHDFARRRIHRAGLAEKVEIRLQDYRDQEGRFDRIASIEMIEAVGEQFWPAYFNQLKQRLKPGGLAGIQAITVHDELFGSYRQRVDFIQRYIFPGGMLPSAAILRTLGERFEMPIVRERMFGQDYARTISLWRDNFSRAWIDLTSLGFDEPFRRMWEYYLCYCEAGFRAGKIDVGHFVFARQG